MSADTGVDLLGFVVPDTFEQFRPVARLPLRPRRERDDPQTAHVIERIRSRQTFEPSYHGPMSIHAYFDGLCQPRNPSGYACGGWYVAPAPDVPGFEAEIRGNGFFVRGREATNNLAEYLAALNVLNVIFEIGYRDRVLLHGDSELVVRQFNGIYKCKKPTLQTLLAQLRDNAARFEQVDVIWVPRELNAIADEESRKAYDSMARTLDTTGVGRG